MDTLGHLLALVVTKASEQERAQVAESCRNVQEATGGSVAHVWVDQGYAGAAPRQSAAKEGIRLEVMGLPETKRGFVLLPRHFSGDDAVASWRQGGWNDDSLTAGSRSYIFVASA